MYKIEQKDYGFKMTLSGIITEEESISLLQEVVKKITAHGQDFYALVDLTKIEIISPIVQSTIIQLQKFVKENGLIRSSVILSDNITKMQFSLIAQKTGIDKIEHYFSTDEPDYEKQAMDWILHGTKVKSIITTE